MLSDIYSLKSLDQSVQAFHKTANPFQQNTTIDTRMILHISNVQMFLLYENTVMTGHARTKVIYTFNSLWFAQKDLQYHYITESTTVFTKYKRSEYTL